MDDLDKLRRFSLVVGLLLITYSSAVEFDASKTISPLGLPFKVVRPALLPIALVLGSVYSAARFAYFGYIAGQRPAPYVRRRWLWEYLQEATFDEKTGSYHMSFSRIEEYRNIRDDLYRHFPGADIRTRRESDPPGLVVKLGRTTRILQWMADVDYSAPIWVNVVAVGIFASRLLWPLLRGLVSGT